MYASISPDGSVGRVVKTKPFFLVAHKREDKRVHIWQ